MKSATPSDCPDCVDHPDAAAAVEDACPDCAPVCDDPASCSDSCVVVCNDACPEGVCESKECSDPSSQHVWVCEDESCGPVHDQLPQWPSSLYQHGLPWPMDLPSTSTLPPLPSTSWASNLPIPWANPGPSAEAVLGSFLPTDDAFSPFTNDSSPTTFSTPSSFSTLDLLPSMTSPPKPTAAFACQWAGCASSFPSMVELVTHVNIAHVPLSVLESAPQPPAVSEVPQLTDAQVLECLWGDCHGAAAATVADQLPQATEWPADVDYEALARHFIQQHLGLPPDVSHVHTTDCGHPDDMTINALLPLPQAQPQSHAHAHPHTHSHSHPHSHAVPHSHSQMHHFQHVLPHPQFTAPLPPPLMAPSFSTDSASSSAGSSSSPLSPLSSHLASSSSPSTSSSSSSSAGTPTTMLCQWEGCTHSYPNSDLLTAHITEAHVGGGHSSYECRWAGCDRHGSKAFGSKQKVLRHMQAHTGHRPFKCEHCGQFFSEAATLQQHIRRHTNEKPHVCDHPGCGKAFAITGALTIHKRIHNGEKPFECTYCNRRFSESSNLSKHLRVHTGARPYPCTVPGCDKKFARPDQAQRHLATHEKSRRGVGSASSDASITSSPNPALALEPFPSY